LPARSLLPLTLNYNTESLYRGFEALREIGTVPQLRKQNKKKNLSHVFHIGQQLINRLDALEAQDREAAEKLAARGINFLGRLRSLGIRSWVVDREEEKTGKLLLHLLFLAVTFPFFLFGFLFNALPFFILDFLVNRKVKQEIFRSTFSFGLGIVLFPVFLPAGDVAGFTPSGRLVSEIAVSGNTSPCREICSFLVHSLQENPGPLALEADQEDKTHVVRRNPM